ncbi:MAG: zf-HC2 domain-containing protein [Actinomycetota bacterium]|nr:zf-HC2 domain-containing protein [Actinomycetota bacterium]
MNRFEHRRLRQGVEAYLDGEADPALAVRVRRHLAECWSCSEDAEWLVLIKAVMARVGRRRPAELAVARLGRFATSLLDRR